MLALTLHLNFVLTLTDEVFWKLCQQNLEMGLERISNGNVIVMAPVGGEGSSFNLSLVAQLWNWNQQACFGVAFDLLLTSLLHIPWLIGQIIPKCSLDGSAKLVRQAR